MSPKPTKPIDGQLTAAPMYQPELYIVVAQFSKVQHTWGSKVETYQKLVIADNGDKAVSFTRLHFAKRHNLEPNAITILTYTRCNGGEAFLDGTDGNEYNVRIGIAVVGNTDDWEGTPTYVPNDVQLDTTTNKGK